MYLDLSYFVICTRFPIATGEWQHVGHAVNGVAAKCTRWILSRRRYLVSVLVIYENLIICKYLFCIEFN
ncbi:hypothetical protein BDA96_03G461900 [Sorghum bicolor]|uniref:Uncharacterized protein n=1 Tax=Sorghum bicolor TaxID=4558 RepID=A0A921RIS7_SORBI|nr:hypothetical protein BDA96_03G461900 [Sorghum bicolor]